VLPSGKILAGSLFTADTYLFDPATSTWSFAATKLRNERSDEETWTLLPDGSVLSYDNFSSANSGISTAQRYIPSTNTWVDTGVVERRGHQRPDGRARQSVRDRRLPDHDQRDGLAAPLHR
jgi:hypothetical protein